MSYLLLLKSYAGLKKKVVSIGYCPLKRRKQREAMETATPVSVSMEIFIIVFTPHAQRERGKVISRGVHIYIYIYICLWSKKKFESYFRDRLTFSNVDSRTSRLIYRLALLLRAPETLSSLSKSRISIFNAHLTLLVRKMTSHNSIGKYRHLVN